MRPGGITIDSQTYQCHDEFLQPNGADGGSNQWRFGVKRRLITEKTNPVKTEKALVPAAILLEEPPIATLPLTKVVSRSGVFAGWGPRLN